MNDEQWERLIEAINGLTEAVSDSSRNIVNAIDNIYPASNDGIEKRLSNLIDVVYDISCK